MRKSNHLEQAYAKNLGAWLQQTRETLGLSLGSLGAEIGVHRNTIWRWEMGEGIPNVYHYTLIKRLARQAGVKV